MCKFESKIDNATPVKVWKVVLEKDGKYYSPATGVCYSDLPPGPIQIDRDQTRSWYDKQSGHVNSFLDMTDEYNVAYNSRYEGLTAGFVERSGAEDCFTVPLEGYMRKVILIEIIPRYRGSYGDKVYIGEFQKIVE